MSSKKIVIFAFGFIFFLGLLGAGVWFVLSDFETIAEEGITFKKVHTFVSIDNLSIPVRKGRRFSHYMVADVKIEISDKNKRDNVLANMSFFRDAALRDLHRETNNRTDGVPGIDIRFIKERMTKIAVEQLGEELVIKVYVTKLLKAAT